MTALRSSVLLALGVAAALGAAAPAASAAAGGSIAYVKDHDLWVQTADGSQRHQITKDGEQGFTAWHSPSWAPDGTLWASNREQVVHLTQAGEVLARIDTPAHTDSTSWAIDGVPLWVDASPDGAKVAYGYIHTTCPPGASCGSRSIVGITDATGATPAATYGTELNMRQPSWYGANELLVFGGAGQQVNVDTPTGERRHWFDQHDVFPNAGTADLIDGEVSPDRRRLALVRVAGGDRKLITFELTGEPGAGLPQPACAAGPLGPDADPTWSPDSTSVAVSSADGIEIGDFTTRGEAGCASQTWKTVAPAGATEPDWSAAAFDPAPKGAAPAPKPAPAPIAPATPKPAPGPGAGPSPAGGPAPTAAPKVTKGRPSLRGRTVRASVTCATACRYTATLVQGKRTIARRTGTAAAGKKVTVRFAVDAKTARRLRGKALSLRVSAKAA